MVDPRITKHAEILVDYSLKVKKGENVMIMSDFAGRPLVLEIYKLLIKKGINQVVRKFSDYEFREAYYNNASKDQIATFPKIKLDEMQKMDCYIRISAPTNTRGLTNIPSERIALRKKTTRPITDYRVEKTRWVVTKFPTEAQAQEADMSMNEYSDFVFSAINDIDWNKKHKEQEKLARILTKTKKVRIIGSGTELILYKSGRKAINADGEYNMPDGEVFTSIEETKADGFIAYSFPALYMGKEFHNVRLEFQKGKVVKAIADKGEEDLNKIINMDSGSRTIGELGIGNNFAIQKFTKDILFDEKIGGSIHIALGNGYKQTGSKNVSGLHWDMIKDLRVGGELYFDNKLVQKNGKWKIELR